MGIEIFVKVVVERYVQECVRVDCGLFSFGGGGCVGGGGRLGDHSTMRLAVRETARAISDVDESIPVELPILEAALFTAGMVALT